MANVRLSAKAVGDIVKLNVNGAAREFIVVHQGKPGSIYDDSCDGTWLLMKGNYEKRRWNNSASSAPLYAKSDIHSYLNSTFLALFDVNIQNAIKQVKIPYCQNSTSKVVTSGSDGLSTKIFLLSAAELSVSNSFTPTDEGATLSYFAGCSTTSADARRVAILDYAAAAYWTRTPYIQYGSYFAFYIGSTGAASNDNAGSSGYCIRPALVLPSTLLVADDGTVSTNAPPTISSASGASGVNLGTKSAAFSFQYTPSDADGDSLTVTEKLDGVTMKTRTNVTSGTKLTFECASTAAGFQKILNGSHTITIEVSDGQETATFGATFTKAVYSASITLSAPLAVEGDITLAVTSVVGSIPDDATYKVEVTNNAKDTTPVWQDVTQEVKQGANIIFANKTAVNGAAFNFRITCKRGASNAGGYISVVSGAFE